MPNLSVFCFIAVVAVGLPATASCLQAGKAAQQMCASETLTSLAQSKKDEVLRMFKPANGRMSPESCQGFSDAYNDFKKLSQDYMANCRRKIQEATQACRGGSTIAEIDDLSIGMTLVDAALNSLPGLKMYSPVMDNLDQRLRDCLRDTPGRIVNTNTNRGDANSPGFASETSNGTTIYSETGRILRSEDSTSAVGPSESDQAGLSRGQSIRAERAPYCSDPALADSSMCTKPMASVELQRQNQNQSHNTNAILGHETAPGPARISIRSPSSVAGSKRFSNSGSVNAVRRNKAFINNKHSNIFKLIHIRYRSQIW